MGSKGSKTTTSTQSQDWGPTEDVGNRYRALLDRISDVGNTPYQDYTGNRVAGFSPDQLAGFQAVRDAAGIQTPYLQAASDYARQGAAPISGQQIANYYNPYQQSVVNATMANINETNAQQQQQLQGNAALRGALGGDRIGVAQAELARQQNLSNNSTLAGIQQQGFNTALGAAQQDAARAGQAAYTFGSLGQTAQNLALNNANALMNTGGLQQQLNQAQLNVPYQDFLQRQAFPYQQAQWLAGLTTGIGSQMGGHSEGTGSVTQPGPSGLGQIFGGLTTGFGLLGQSGAFGPAGWLAGLKDGGAVKGIHRAYAAGGTVPESIDTLMAQQQALLDGRRPVQMFPKGTRELPLPRGLLRIKTENGVFHYDPAQIDGETIKHLSSIGRENELLGLGPYSKDDVAQHVAMGETPLAIVERGPDGVERRAAAGTNGTAPDQIQAMSAGLEPGNSFYLEEPGTTLGARKAGYAEGGGISAPFRVSNSWIPEIGITAQPMRPPAPMNTPGAAPQKEGGVGDMAGLGKGLGMLGGGLKDLFNSPLDISAPDIGGFESTGLGETMFNAPGSILPPIYAAGGAVEPPKGFGGIAPFKIPDEDAPIVDAVPVIAPSVAPVDAPLNFSDRFAPAQQAIKEGIFDPQGANYTDLDQRLPVAGIPLPMARPQQDNIAADTGPMAPSVSGEAPSALNPRGGINTGYIAPSDDAALPDKAQLTQAKKEFPWMALTAAGLGMLASESPYAGVAIGQGGLQGLKTYAAQQEAERKQAHDLAANAIQQRRVDLEARRLDDAAKRADATLAETTRYHSGMLDRSKFMYLGPTQDGKGSVLMDTRTGEQIVSNVPVAPKTGAAVLTDDARDIAARQLINGDLSGLANMGRGAQGDAKLTAIRNRAAEILVAEGKTPEEAAAHLSAQVQRYKASGIGQSAEARTAATREANLNIILKATDAAIPAAIEASRNIARTGFVPLNKIIQKGQVMTSNPELREFGMANLQLAEHWARAMNPTGVMRESDREKALEFLSTADSPETYERAVRQLQKQIQRERDAVASQRGPGGHSAPVAPGAGAPAAAGANGPAVTRPTSVPAGSAYSPSRKMWRAPDGTLFDAAGNKVQ